MNTLCFRVTTELRLCVLQVAEDDEDALDIIWDLYIKHEGQIDFEYWENVLLENPMYLLRKLQKVRR